MSITCQHCGRTFSNNNAAANHAACCPMQRTGLDAVLASVRSISEELGYPAGTICSRVDFGRVAGDTLLSALISIYAHWRDVARAAGLRIEPKGFYLSIAHRRRLNAQAAESNECKPPRRIFDYDDDDPCVLQGVSQRRERERMVYCNGQCIVRYDEVTVLR